MGTTIGGLGPGLGGPVDPFDPNYETQLLIAANQKQADADNAKAAAMYQARAAQILADNVQQLANHQPLLTIDPPPHKEVLSADGLSIVQSTDLVTAPISVVPAATGDTGAPLSTGAPAFDASVLQSLATIKAMLGVMKTELDAVKAKVGA